MSPRAADPGLHAAVVTAAAGLLAAGGRTALTTRRLAAEVGTSTMAIYTRFGSLDEVHQAVREHGFGQLSAQLDAVPETHDPVADLTAVGLAYYAYAVSNPELYRAMFTDRPPEHDDAGAGVFDQIVAAVRSCIAAGRFDPGEPTLVPGWAAQVWVADHGMATLALSGLQPSDRIRLLLADMTYRLAVGYGDRPGAARRSTERAMSAAVPGGDPRTEPGRASSPTTKATTTRSSG